MRNEHKILNIQTHMILAKCQYHYKTKRLLKQLLYTFSIVQKNIHTHSIAVTYTNSKKRKIKCVDR